MKSFRIIVRCLCGLIIAATINACDSEVIQIQQVSDKAVSRSVDDIMDESDHFIIKFYNTLIKSPEWKEYNSLQQRLDACQLPANMLDNLSTEDLVIACVYYPMSINYITFDDRIEGINKVIEEFNGFTELRNREEGIDKLIVYYENISNAMIKEVKRSDLHTATLRYHADFIETILSSELFELNQNNIISVYPIIERNMSILPSYKSNQCEGFVGHNYLIKRCHKLLCNLEDQKVEVSDSNSNLSRSGGQIYFPTYINVSTRWGKTVEACTYDDYGSASVQIMDSVFRNRYPNAIFLSSSSLTYNSHSYAWHISDDRSPVCCISHKKASSPNSAGPDNISAYWTHDYYVQTNLESEAVKAYFPSDKISSVKSSVPGYFETKLNNGPLLRHTLSDAPFNTSGAMYFKPNPSPCGHVSINWSNDNPTVGQTVRLSYDYTVHNVNYASNTYIDVWAYTAKGEEYRLSDRPDIATITTNTSQKYMDIVFSMGGFYYAKIVLYTQNNQVIAEQEAGEIFVDY